MLPRDTVPLRLLSSVLPYRTADRKAYRYGQDLVGYLKTAQNLHLLLVNNSNVLQLYLASKTIAAAYSKNKLLLHKLYLHAASPRVHPRFSRVTL